MAFFSRFFKKTHTILISDNDKIETYLAEKFCSGENIDINIEENETFGKQFVISSNQFRKTFFTNKDAIIYNKTGLIIVDASKNPVNLTLPNNHKGILSIVCENATYGINLIGNLFDSSNINFHIKGDSLMLINNDGIWYVVGRYCASWYC